MLPSRIGQLGLFGGLISRIRSQQVIAPEQHQPFRVMRLEPQVARYDVLDELSVVPTGVLPEIGEALLLGRRLYLVIG